MLPGIAQFQEFDLHQINHLQLDHLYFHNHVIFFRFRYRYLKREPSSNRTASSSIYTEFFSKHCRDSRVPYCPSSKDNHYRFFLGLTLGIDSFSKN